MGSGLLRRVMSTNSCLDLGAASTLYLVVIMSKGGGKKEESIWHRD